MTSDQITSTDDRENVADEGQLTDNDVSQIDELRQISVRLKTELSKIIIGQGDVIEQP